MYSQNAVSAGSLLKINTSKYHFFHYYTEKPTFNAQKPWETQRKSSRPTF